MKISDLFTRQNAETAKPMEVTTVEGIKTGLFMQVLGSESTAFIQARREYLRRRLVSNEKGDNANDPILSSEFEYARMVACLVVEWDFEEECTKDNRIKLFYETPYLATQVENFALTTGNKIEAEKPDSSTTPESASS